MAEPMLEVRGLAGGYGEVDILQGVDLDVAAGEIVCVVGTNGAGKSTLIKAVMGLLPRVRGELRFEGRALAGAPAYTRLARGIAYVPQVTNVFPDLSVLDNLLVVQGVSEPRRRASELLEVFEALAPLRARRAGSLSGGERQQLAFAMALMARPRLVCLDEPTAALAPLLVQQVFEQIARLPALGCTVLMVEQRAREALRIADRGIVMDQGRVAMAGAARGLLDDPRAVELYLGRDA